MTMTEGVEHCQDHQHSTLIGMSDISWEYQTNYLQCGTPGSAVVVVVLAADAVLS